MHIDVTKSFIFVFGTRKWPNWMPKGSYCLIFFRTVHGTSATVLYSSDMKSEFSMELFGLPGLIFSGARINFTSAFCSTVQKWHQSWSYELERYKIATFLPVYYLLIFMHNHGHYKVHEVMLVYIFTWTLQVIHLYKTFALMLNYHLIF